MASEQLTIWAKAGLSLADGPVFERQSTQAKKTSKNRREFFAHDILGLFLWGYLTIELLLDRPLRRYSLLHGYKLLVAFLIAVALLVLTVKFARKLRRHVAYIVLFPFVLLFWKPVKVIYRARSWVLFLAVANALANARTHLKFNLVSKPLITLAALFILTAESKWLLAVSIVVLGSYIAARIFRAVKFSILPSTFLKLQEALIKKFGGWFSKIGINTELKSDTIKKFNKQQLTMLARDLSTAVLATQFLYFWAYQLDRYRKSGATHIFGTLSYAWLFFETVIVFSLINLAIFKSDPASFSSPASGPNLLLFTYYSLSALFVNGISGLEPSGTWPLLVAVIEGFTGPILLATLVLNHVMSARQMRDDSGLLEIVSNTKKRAVECEQQIQAEYEIKSIRDALVRLQQLQQPIELIQLVSVPDDFLDAEPKALVV